MATKHKSYKKIALTLSLCLLIVWTIFGTGTSLAWFTDTSDTTRNIFHFADFDLEVSYLAKDGTYKPIDAEDEVFDKNALYEPGYVQTVYFKIENKGTVDFTYQTAVGVYKSTTATNVFGSTFDLQNYLKFGMVTADSEENLRQAVKTRDLAKQIATEPLDNYYSTKDATLKAGATQYFALIIRMPEEVDNFANYRGEKPEIELRVIVNATQQ